MDRADHIIRNTEASLRIEGLEVTDEDKELMRRCILGEISFDDAVRSVLEEYNPE